MSKKIVSLCLLLAALAAAAGGGVAQADDNPTVAILRFGPLVSSIYMENAILDSLLATGEITEAEWQQLHERQDLTGERINILWGDAQFDNASAHTLVESMLDKNVDVLVTSATPMTAAAVNATADLESAPAIIFGEVYAPYAAGIAQSSCIKPPHVTGVAPETPYSEILPLLRMQDPAIETIGTIYSLSEISGVVGAEQIKLLGAELGMTVLEYGVNSAPDLALATDAIIERGAEALILPSDNITMAGLPIMMESAAEHSIPVFHAISTAMGVGATVGAGTSQYDWQGSLIASLLTGHLNGEVDIASAGIAAVNDMVIGINLDIAQRQDLTISDTLLESAHLVIKDGVVVNNMLADRLRALGLEGEALKVILDQVNQLGAGASLSDFPPEAQKQLLQLTGGSMADRAASMRQDIASLACTPERIAEQQAELDAADA